ncbi:MAG: hypothetical protein HUU55_21230 [Myxococcales bacterium]|nr:hypothetical protein [Myxococcales bacterium]
MSRFSYERIIGPRFSPLLGETLPEGVDVTILLYNFEYDGSVHEVRLDDRWFVLMGLVSYR